MVREKIISVRLIALLLFASLLAVSIFSEEQRYELDELIDIGLSQSVGITTEELQYLNSRSSLISSYLDFLPTATFAVGKHYSDRNSKSAGFSLSKSIALNEPTYFNWRRTSIDWENANLLYGKNRLNVVFDIFHHFITVAEAEKRIEIQQKNLSIQERIKEQIELLYELEQRSLIDLKQSQISWINAQIAVENAENRLIQARESLFHYLNLEDDGYPMGEVRLQITDEIYDYETPVEVVKAENDLAKTSLTLTQSKLDFLPRLSLSYNYDYRYPGPPVTNDLFAFDKYEDSYTISLTASYSLFNLVEHRQVYNRTKRNRQIQEIMLDDLDRNKKKQFDQLLRDYNSEKRLYSLAEQRFDLAEETLDMSQSKFDIGILSLLEFDQATKDYLEAELELISREYQLLLKQEELNLFLSRPLLGKWQ
jgi:outer membrane protein